MRRLQHGLALALAAASVSACTTYHRTPDLSVAPSYEVPGDAQVSDAQLDKWWLLFNDPVLNALENDAFALSPDARTATARLMEARATRTEAHAATLPQGQLQGNTNRRQVEDLSSGNNSLIPVGGNTDSETLNFNVSWEIDLFGRLATARKIANSDYAATRFNVEGSRAALAANVADNYFLIRGLTIQVSESDETVRIQQDLLNITQKRVAA
jgi:outer membrane protein TolC